MVKFIVLIVVQAVSGNHCSWPQTRIVCVSVCVCPTGKTDIQISPHQMPQMWNWNSRGRFPLELSCDSAQNVFIGTKYIGPRLCESLKCAKYSSRSHSFVNCLRTPFTSIATDTFRPEIYVRMYLYVRNVALSGVAFRVSRLVPHVLLGAPLRSTYINEWFMTTQLFFFYSINDFFSRSKSISCCLRAIRFNMFILSKSVVCTRHVSETKRDGRVSARRDSTNTDTRASRTSAQRF